eukprot:3156571-Pleurochrysis_carterae.AAC.3
MSAMQWVKTPARGRARSGGLRGMRESVKDTEREADCAYLKAEEQRGGKGDRKRGRSLRVWSRAKGGCGAHRPRRGTGAE